MAQHASALKRHRQNLKRRVRNKALKTQLRHIIRTTRASLDEKNPTNLAETLAAATRALDKAATKGVIHRNAAARKISRLAHAAHALKA